MKIRLEETDQALGRRAPLNMDFDAMTAKQGEQEGVVRTDKGLWLRLRYEHGRSLELQVVDGECFRFERCDDGYWVMPLSGLHGFCYVKVILDGNWVLSPYLPIGYGDNHPMNFLDLSDGAEEKVPPLKAGTVCREGYFSRITGTAKYCYVYTPREYAEGDKKYPILYLQHGYGENELGWLYQGKLAEIADRLTDAGEMEPMVIVMADGMMRCAGENGDIVHKPELFVKELLEDIMPAVESRYRIKDGGEYHAMAGLSMGSLQTSMTSFENPGLFEWIGLFSGFMSNIFDGNDAHLDVLKANGGIFNSKTRLFFRAMGQEDPFWPVFEKDDAFCREYGIDCVRKIYEGAHTWNVWRECIKDFLPMLFK